MIEDRQMCRDAPSSVPSSREPAALVAPAQDVPITASPSLAPAGPRIDPPSKRRGALVLGGAHGSLATIRDLGRHGIPAWYVTDDHLISRFSRFTERSFFWPGPDHPEAAGYLLELARRHRLEGWVLFPGGDAEARMLSRHHEELEATYRLTTPPWDVAKWAYDKRLTNQRAAELGIDFPWSHYPRDRDELARLQCRFPLILKPTIRERHNAFTDAKAWRVDDRAALLRRYDEAVALVGERAIVVQELIPGGGSAQFSYAGLWDRGTPVASLVARRARQYPIDFGYTSTFVETIEQDRVEEEAVRFLRSIGYSGIVEVEFKYDERDKRYKILDVNARAWTWIALGRLAGVDFPYLAWRQALGVPLSPSRGRTGVAWMHLSRDLAAACHEMRAGTLSPLSYLRSFREPLVFAAFAKDDPLPGVVDLPLVIWRLLARRLPFQGRRGG